MCACLVEYLCDRLPVLRVELFAFLLLRGAGVAGAVVPGLARCLWWVVAGVLTAVPPFLGSWRLSLAASTWGFSTAGLHLFSIFFLVLS